MAYDIRTRFSVPNYFVEWRTDIGDPWTVGAVFDQQAAADDAALYFVPPGVTNITNPPPVRYEDRIFLSAANMPIEAVRSGTVVFSNTNGFSFGFNSNSVFTGSYDGYGLTANINYALGGNSAGGSSGTANTLFLAGGNNLTISGNNGSLTFSAANQSQQTQNIIRGVVAGGVTQTSGTVEFSNSNGLTFGLNAGTLTASHNGITSQTVQGQSFTLAGNSVGQSTITGNTITLAGGNNITLSGAAGAITISAANQTAQTQNVIQALSAGTQSVTSGTMVFSNSNGVTFGMSGSSRITASHNGLTSQSNQALSAGNGSFAFQTASFSNANGISFSTSAGSAIVASHNGLTSQSNQNVTAANGGFAFQTLSFSNVNGISFGTSAGSAITASQDGIKAVSVDGLGNVSNGTLVLSATSDGHIQWQMAGSTVVPYLIDAPLQINLRGNSAGNNTIDTLNTLFLSGGNNITISGAANGSIVFSGPSRTATSYATGNTLTQYVSSATFGTNSTNDLPIVFGAGNISVGLTSNFLVISGQDRLSFAAGTQTMSSGFLNFGNANNVTFGMNNSTITASVSQSNQTLAFVVNGNTAGTTYTATHIELRGGNNITLSGAGPSQYIEIIGAAAGAGLGAISAGTQLISVGTARFLDSNGITFGMSNSSAITASHNGMTGLVVAAPGSTQTWTRLTFTNAGNVSFGMNAGSIITANATFGVPIAAGTTNTDAGLVSFANSNGVGFGLNGQTITASIEPANFSAHPLPFMINTVTAAPRQSSSVAFPFAVPAGGLSFNVVHAPISASMGSTTLGTTANTTFTMGLSETNRFVIYSRQTGLSTQSLTSFYSFSDTNAMSIRVQANANGSQYSVTHGATHNHTNGSSSSWSTTYALSNATFNISTTHLGFFTGMKIRAHSLATLLGEGDYVLMSGVSSSTQTQGIAGLSAARSLMSHLALSNIGGAILGEGSNTVAQNMRSGMGSYTNAAGNTTAALNYSQITTQASNAVPYMSFIFAA